MLHNLLPNKASSPARSSASARAKGQRGPPSRPSERTRLERTRVACTPCLPRGLTRGTARRQRKKNICPLAAEVAPHQSQTYRKNLLQIQIRHGCLFVVLGSLVFPVRCVRSKTKKHKIVCASCAELCAEQHVDYESFRSAAARRVTRDAALANALQSPLQNAQRERRHARARALVS